MWLANGDTDPNYSVTELDAKTGAVLRTISGSQYQFDAPGGIAVAGGRVWVTNTDANSVTELDARTGAAVRVIFGSKYRFEYPSP